MKYLEAYLNRTRHPEKNTDTTTKIPTKPTEPGFDGFVGIQPKGMGLKMDLPQPEALQAHNARAREELDTYFEKGILRPVEADLFKIGFDALYQRLHATGGAWEKTAYRETIKAALDRMDRSWVAGNLSSFQTTVEEINRLVSLAVMEWGSNKE